MSRAIWVLFLAALGVWAGYGLQEWTGTYELRSLERQRALEILERPSLPEPAAAIRVQEDLPPAILQLEEVFQRVSAKVSEAVVYILVRTAVPEGHPGGRVQGQGSGFLISPDGYILTNNHVVDGATEIQVTLRNRNTYSASIVGAAPEFDIAVLKIGVENAPYLEFADDEEIAVGQWVLAIGNPLGYTYTVTEGIVSAVDRPAPPELGLRTSLLQTSAAINQGNSGGPLVNLRGRVVGVNFLIQITLLGKAEGIGFAIPARTARFAAKQLIAKGKVEIGYLGVYLQNISMDQAEALGLETPRGVYVAKVEEGGPADKAGIRSGDVLLKYRGIEIRNASHLQWLVVTTEPGTTVELELLRKRKVRRVQVRIGRLQESEREEERGTADDWGFTVAPLTREMADELQISPPEGVLIVEVRVGSPASVAGLTERMVIVGIGDMDIRNMRDFRQAMERYREARRLVVRAKSPGNLEGLYVLRRE